jgi:hypothetical protein
VNGGTVRELHVVAVSEDGRHVVLAARRGSSKGAFKVALDGPLAAAVRGDLPRAGDAEVPEISPKEIQARLRSGESVAKIAQSAGVPTARVERYAGPVQGEMARIIDATRSAYLVRGRLGRSAVDLGTAVSAAVEASGAADDPTEWSTFRQDDGLWLVTVSWTARKRLRKASWRYDPAQKAVTAVDPASAALAHVDATEHVVPKKKPAPKAVQAPAKKAPAKKAPAKRAAPAKKAPAGKAPAKQAPTVKKAAAKKAPAAKTAPKPLARKPIAKKAPVRALRVVPDPPVRTRAKGSAAKGRASVPAWADVLLGTSPGGDR